MSAFQWGIGSSTYWLLSSLGIDRLTTIAHDARHVSTAHTVIPDNLKSKWTVHIIPPVAQPITFQQAESYVHYFRAYSDLTGIVTGTSSDGDGDSSINDFKTQRQQYDVVLVDGQSRSSCLTRAVSLLKPEGGVLILAGAQRGGYQEATQSVPPHWKRYRDRNAMGLESVIWMSCVVNERGEYDGGGGDRRLNDDV
jgi:predicted O-methyltransferase YrrM